MDPLSRCPSEADLAGRARACEGCPGRELCLSQSTLDPDQEQIDCRMKAIKHKILIVSGKGGVGKSSIAASLSMALAQMSHKVGLVDLDICGPSVPKLLSVEDQVVVNSTWGWQPLKSPFYDIKVMSTGAILNEDSRAVIWRGPRKTALIKRFLKDVYWGRLDFLMFDTPPGTSDEHLTVVKVLKGVEPDGAVIVTTPQEVALDTIRKEIDFCRKMSLPIIGIVENMSGFICPCCQAKWDIYCRADVEKLASKHGITYLGRVPLDPELSKCCEYGQNYLERHKEAAGARAIISVTELIVDKLRSS
ncbi:uncharacterized protein [Oscarella lobularis]|uniref:uncharacterized protein n=1 Tax=Oscarella lobularis TaxID=121494 RepID=UPI00331439B3